jgi:hypothetical protein
MVMDINVDLNVVCQHLERMDNKLCNVSSAMERQSKFSSWKKETLKMLSEMMADTDVFNYITVRPDGYQLMTAIHHFSVVRHKQTGIKRLCEIRKLIKHFSVCAWSKLQDGKPLSELCRQCPVGAVVKQTNGKHFIHYKGNNYYIITKYEMYSHRDLVKNILPIL